MQSHYEINVSFKGRHLFATAPRSCVDFNQAREVFEQITCRFPKSEGYEVTCMHYECGGTRVTFNK